MKNKKEIVLYLVFGVLTTLVSWGSYVLFVNVLNFSIFWANSVSWILSVAFAFVTNKIWVFNSRQWGAKSVLGELAKFVTSRAVTGFLEIVGVPFLASVGFDNLFYALVQKTGLEQVEIFMTDGIYSKMVFAVIVVILNYVFSKLLVFTKRKKTE